jgi:MFS family permease
MDPQWYYARDGVQYGPLNEAELKQKADRGEVRAADLVWKKGMTDWLPAATVPEVWPGSRQSASLGDMPPPPPHTGAPAVDWTRVKEGAMLHIRRVFTWDLQAITPSPDERIRLAAAGVHDTTAQRFAVWRRSVLWFVVPPLALAGLLALIRALANASDLSPMGVLLALLTGLSVAALPVVAYLGARSYDRPRRSSRIILIGALITFLVPFVVALAPIEWWIEQDLRQATSEQLLVLRATFGIVFFLSLIPAVLSLLPGLCRACVRTKTLLPGSIAPGWALLAGAPFQLLLSVVAFILIYHIASNVLFILGLLLLMGAPLIYLTRYSLFTRPLTRPEESRDLTRLVGYVVMTAWAGVALLLVFMLTGRLGDQRILGFDSTALVRPWSGQLHSWWIEYLGRSLFITVVFADQLMRMNLSIWRQEHGFYRTANAADYDRTMRELSESLEGIPVLAPADETSPQPEGDMTPAEAMSKSM